MDAEFPADLKPDIQGEVVRILPMLRAAGWTLDPIRWDWVSVQDRWVYFGARSSEGSQAYITCAEDLLPERLTLLLSAR
jgi:hypothetical protein